MSRYVSETLRALVAKNAQFRCEYCLIFERHSIFPFHIEHIISLKTDIGTTTLNILGLKLFTSVEQRRILIEKNKLL